MRPRQQPPDRASPPGSDAGRDGPVPGLTGELQLAVVGLGYWGPNILRNAWDVGGASVRAICDRDPDTLARYARRYPTVATTDDYEAVLGDPEIDAVMLITPTSTHYEMGQRCLEAGKHLFVEKPLATTVEECDRLIASAQERDLVLMPGHTFLYSPPVLAVKEKLEREELGRLYFATFSRVNLGPYRSDVNVVRDFAPHDFAMLLYWFGKPAFARAIGARSQVVPGNLDVAFIDVGYHSGFLAHIEVSWLAPTKLRRTVVVGTEKMVVYEDGSGEPLRVYDRGIEVAEPRAFGEYQLTYRAGDVISPRLDPIEPLSSEVQDFVDAIRHKREPRSTKELGREVVRLIEAAESSLEWNGAPVSLDIPGGDRRSAADRRRSVGGMPVIDPPGG